MLWEPQISYNKRGSVKRWHLQLQLCTPYAVLSSLHQACKTEAQGQMLSLCSRIFRIHFSNYETYFDEKRYWEIYTENWDSFWKIYVRYPRLYAKITWNFIFFLRCYFFFLLFIFLVSYRMEAWGSIIGWGGQTCLKTKYDRFSRRWITVLRNEDGGRNVPRKCQQMFTIIHGVMSQSRNLTAVSLWHLNTHLDRFYSHSA